MMVVVPSFAEGEQCDPPVVARIVPRLEALLAPHVRCRIDEPRRMQADGDAQKDAPQHPRPTAKRVKDDARRNQRHVVEAVDHPMHAIFHQIGRISSQRRFRMLLCCADQNPTDVRPPTAIARRMRIAFVIGVRVMYAMRGDPVDRTAFERQRATQREEIFERTRRLEPPVRQQSVIANADAQPARYPEQKEHHQETRPTPVKKRYHSAGVKDDHGDGSGPIKPRASPRLQRFGPSTSCNHARARLFPEGSCVLHS